MNRAKSKKFKPGDTVLHHKYGKGIVYGEWGALKVQHHEGAPDTNVFCGGIYDAIFLNEYGKPFLHSATKEHFKK
jgi:hypothetical protein